MYYQTPNVSRYVDFIIGNRFTIIVFYLLLVLSAAVLYQPKILSSDAMFWLKDAKELQKTEARDFRTHYLSKLTVHVGAFDDTTRQALASLQEQLASTEGVERVASLFSRDLGETKKVGEDSEMVGIVNVGDLDVYRIRKLVKGLCKRGT